MNSISLSTRSLSLLCLQWSQQDNRAQKDLLIYYIYNNLNEHDRTAVYRQIIFSKKMNIFNDNSYLTYCYLSINFNISKISLTSQTLISKPYIEEISDQDIIH